MTLNPANAGELAEIAGEVGAKALEGHPGYPSQTCGRRLGDVDLGAYLDQYRGKLLAEEWERDVRSRQLPGPDVLDQVSELLDGEDE
jgi:hypothetical protein